MGGGRPRPRGGGAGRRLARCTGSPPSARTRTRPWFRGSAGFKEGAAAVAAGAAPWSARARPATAGRRSKWSEAAGTRPRCCWGSSMKAGIRT